MAAAAAGLNSSSSGTAATKNLNALFSGGGGQVERNETKFWVWPTGGNSGRCDLEERKRVETVSCVDEWLK